MLKLFKKKTVIDPRPELRQLLADCRLPTFPAAVMAVLRMLRDPETSLEEVGGAIQADPGLVIKVLRTVNCAAFGLTRSVDTVPHAVAMLGRARVESLVLGLAVGQVLPREAAPGYDHARFWRAAARRASLARVLAQRIHPATQAEAFTGALLQDMAVPILATALPDRYGPVLETWHREGASALHHLESEAFGWDHGEVGALVASHWELPAGLTAAVRGHHGSDAEAVAPAVRLVAHVRETDENPGVDRLVAAAADEFNLQADAVVAAVKEGFERASELARLLT